MFNEKHFIGQVHEKATNQNHINFSNKKRETIFIEKIQSDANKTVKKHLNFLRRDKQNT